MNRFEGLANNKPNPMGATKPFTEEEFTACMKALRERGLRSTKDRDVFAIIVCMASGVISEETGKRIIKRLEDGNNED